MTTRKKTKKKVVRKTAKREGPAKGTKRVVKKKAQGKKKGSAPSKRKVVRKKKAPLRKARPAAPLKADEVVWRCGLEHLDFVDTSKVEPLQDIMGQDRALKALRLGVDLFAPGYNIYVSGMSGTGKMTTVKKILEKIRPRCPVPRDFCYVYNFANPYHPHLLTFPQAGGGRFRRKMERVLHVLKEELPAAVESGPFAERRESIAEAYLKKQKEIFHAFEEELKRNGFVLSQIRVGQATRPEILIPVDEKTYPYEQLAVLVESGQLKLAEGATLEEIAGKHTEFRKQMRQVMKESRRLNEEMMERLERLERGVVSDLISDLIEEIRDEFGDQPKIGEYLDAMKEHILTHREQLKGVGSAEGLVEAMRAGEPADPYLPYRVNMVLDSSNTRPCPVVIETNPTFNNVFGTIERSVTRFGQAVTDFTRIKAGSLLQADGGYLVLNALDALSEPGLWKTMKRVLTYRELVIQGIEGILQLSTVGLKPEPIDLDVKVILIGPPHLYFLLHQHDEDFRKIFKVRADFDHEIDRTDTAVEQYASFVAFLTGEENLKPFTPEAVGRLVEHGVRRAGRRTRITSRFGEIADVIRESSFWADREKEKRVSRGSVENALAARRHRTGLIEEKVRNRVRDGIVLIDSEGERVGQVNGLAVLTYGEHRFGIPSRITASVGVGKAGIINVEREAKLSGSTHDKGVLILGGYLRDQFAREAPLALTASICFEQSYGGVDGDSASSTELYALLSALAEVPIRQDLAVTGSVNQKGDIQAIGGANEKIEGFFQICLERGLTGSQGVLIPESNVGDLMLKEEVRRAVEEGLFHIYAVRRIEEGIEILTGKKAGKRGKDGRWEKGTLFGRVQERFSELLARSMPVRKKKVIRKKA